MTDLPNEPKKVAREVAATSDLLEILLTSSDAAQREQALRELTRFDGETPRYKVTPELVEKMIDVVVMPHARDPDCSIRKGVACELDVLVVVAGKNFDPNWISPAAMEKLLDYIDANRKDRSSVFAFYVVEAFVLSKPSVMTADFARRMKAIEQWGYEGQDGSADIIYLFAADFGQRASAYLSSPEPQPGELRRPSYIYLVVDNSQKGEPI